MSNVSSLFETAEERHIELAGEVMDVHEAAKHYPAEHLGCYYSVLAPPGGAPGGNPANAGAETSQCASVVEAVDRGMQLLGADSGFMAMTVHAHTVPLLLGDRNNGGECRKLFLVNGIGSMLRPAGSDAGGDNGTGYVICMEGRTKRTFLQQAGAVLNWHCSDRYIQTGYPGAGSSLAGINGHVVQFDVYRTGETVCRPHGDVAACSTGAFSSFQIVPNST